MQSVRKRSDKTGTDITHRYMRRVKEIFRDVEILYPLTVVRGIAVSDCEGRAAFAILINETVARG